MVSTSLFKNTRIIIILLPIYLGLSCSPTEQYDVSYLEPAEKQVTNTIEGIEYTSGNWQEITYQHAETSLGNHRAVVKVPAGSEAVKLHLPWRRRDINPQDKKRVIIMNPETADTVKNMVVKGYTAEYADIIFQPMANTETYHVYYYPFHTTGSYYPVVNYLTPKITADKNWLRDFDALPEEDYNQLPAAEVISIQSINDFNSFFPMEITANKVEVDSFLENISGDYLLFPEYRNNPIKMTQQLPYHWLVRGAKNGLKDNASRGEYYTFQIGVYAVSKDLNNLSITYTNLQSGKDKIAKEKFECININGVDLGGNSFTKRVDVSQGKIQPLWIGLLVPEETNPGDYSGMVIVQPEGLNADTIHLALTIDDKTIKDYGDDEPENMSRLRWLNSTLGSEEDFIISPFLPVTYEEKTLKILGREIDLGENGLPNQIRSYFTESVTGLNDAPEQILTAPISFNIVKGGKETTWQSEPFKIANQSKSRAEWITNSTSADFDMQVKGVLEYDGMLNYQIAVIAKKDIDVDNIKLQVPYAKESARYILGLGYKGGLRPATINWRWDVTKHHEGVWLGNVNRGIQYVLRDKNYVRPLNTNFYQSQPLNLPPSWYNEGKGGIKIAGNNETVLAENYSGPRKITKGDTLNFHIRFLITPFKTINTNTHFNTRFVHKYTPVDSVKIYGGTVVNIHHANEINPYINYPFYSLDKQKKYIDEAHAKGVKVKLYNTIRELSYKSYELFPMRSLGFEIFNDGDGGGHPWLQEHLEADYHKAWHAWRVNDAAILNKGTSRWTNYYIEGLNWLAKNQDIDGLYLDDIAFSRETVKRMVTVLTRQRGEAIIDLHSANQYNNRDGFINSAFLYMEHFPYISRLWFGEYFEYDLDPDYWLTEVSGIPFGLTGEMLQDGGHPYRGMVYGMTTRVYGKYNPQAIWQLFDDFGIADSEMIGYWVENVPVKVNNPKIRVSIYKKDDKVLLAFGSWSDKDEVVTLNIDWQSLGIDNPEATEWLVPEVKGLQKEQTLEANKPFVVKKGQGLFMIIRKSLSQK